MYKLQFELYLSNTKSKTIEIELMKNEFELFESSKLMTKDSDSIIINNSFFSKDSIVKDEIRYKIIVNGCKEITVNKLKETKKLDDSTKYIVLLLESPHAKEYGITGDKIVPLGPANGNKVTETGGAIDKYLKNVLEKIDISAGGYYLVIMNPIQFQTSLYSVHGKGLKNEAKDLRNLVWKNIWEQQEIRSDFIGRINNYNPEFIINASTKDLKEYVNWELILNKNKNKIYITPHPAVNWSSLKDKVSVKKLR